MKVLPSDLGEDVSRIGNYEDFAVTRQVNSELVCLTFAPRNDSDSSKFMSAKDKVDPWELSRVRAVIRDHLYPLAEIVFNSDQEFILDGKISGVIFKHMRMDKAYNGHSDRQKKEHRKRLWSVWRDLVSRNLDQKRHNQKAIMRRIFWGSKCKRDT